MDRYARGGVWKIRAVVVLNFQSKKMYIMSYQKLRSEVLGINERNLGYVYPYNPRKYFKLADDKVKCKAILEKHGINVPQTYAVVSGIGEIEAALEAISELDAIAIKPSQGAGGGGIKILKKNNQNNWISGGEVITEEEIASHMARIIMGMYSYSTSDQVLIKRCIEPHSFFHDIYPSGVPDFRVIVLKDQAIMAMLRMPTAKSNGKANLHQGGLGIGVDMVSGKLTHTYDGTFYHNDHPDSKKRIKGRSIPQWDQILAIALETAEVFPLDYLGVDIVLDQHLGPMILEINVRPGLGIQLANKKGLKKYLIQNQ